jgi:hypothetical protein
VASARGPRSGRLLCADCVEEPPQPTGRIAVETTIRPGELGTFALCGEDRRRKGDELRQGDVELFGRTVEHRGHSKLRGKPACKARCRWLRLALVTRECQASARTRLKESAPPRVKNALREVRRQRTTDSRFWDGQRRCARRQCAKSGPSRRCGHRPNRRKAVMQVAVCISQFGKFLPSRRAQTTVA